jgi:ribosome-associated protein
LKLPLSGKSDIADRMVVASGMSAKHVGALADYVVTALKHAGYDSVPTEGRESGDWVLVDAGDVIVHIFKPDTREHYNLEKMWSANIPAAEIAL